MMSANDALTLSDAKQNTDAFTGKDVTISGNSEVHLTSKTPLSQSTVNLVGDNAWLYFDNVRATTVQSTYLKDIKIDGQPAVLNQNVRLQIYRGGTAVIPNGIEQANKAITVYTRKNCEGDSKVFGMYNAEGKEIKNTDLGEGFDNNIRSFKLRKGFMAVLANNQDGTGHSRCYIADTDDLIVNELPDGFVTKDGSDKSFVSFIRITKWERVSKKGWAGSDANAINLTNSTNYYGWDAGSVNKSVAAEYSPQRHHIGWPGFGDINNAPNVTHVLGNNEPDNTNDPREHPASPYQVICEWPEYLRTGLRTGSPAPTSIWGSWLKTFFALADSLNYRVDFVVYHQYEHTTDFAGRINKAVEVSNGRPVWVTEWNNGANWTTGNENDWPNKTGIKCDADGNQVAGGESITLPNTTGNADKTYNYIKTALANQDALTKLERLHFYNWVQDARSIVLDGKLTKGGKYFAEYNSDFAYRESAAYKHEWKIAPPLPFLGYSSDYKQAKLSWYDHNGETGTNYEVWVKDGNGSYALKATLVAGQDYTPGGWVEWLDPIDMKEKRFYKVRATAYDGETKSIYSRGNRVDRDVIAEAPSITASAKDYRSVTITWDECTGARGYQVECADEEGGEFKTIATLGSDKFSHSHSGLESGKDYWYRIAVLSNADETPRTETVKVHVASIDEAPVPLENMFVAGGDKKVVITWDAQHQVSYDIERATEENGAYSKVKSGLSSAKYSDTDVENGKTYYYRITPKRYDLVGTPVTVSATPEEGKFFFMPFSEGKGTYAMDIYGATKGTFAPGVTWCEDRFGNEKGAIQLNSSKQGHVTLEKGIVKDLSDYTISIWVKPGSTGGRIFDFGSSTSVFFILNYNGSGTWRYKICGDGKSIDKEWSKTISKTEWSHVVLTQTGTTVTLYVNGTKVGTQTGVYPPSIMGNTTSNYLGMSQWPADPHPDFAFDDMFMFPRGMNEDEVKELMNRTNGIEEILAGEETGFAAYGDKGTLSIAASEAAEYTVYSIDGAAVRTIKVVEGMNHFDGFAPGIYIVNGVKVLL